MFFVVGTYLSNMHQITFHHALCSGLCVDYSAHICHTFLTLRGSRRERAAATLVDIGPAVLNGGISTFIAFILLVTSDSHVFSSFFKIFFLVVVFGLFHGLLLLPVILRLAGPAAYTRADSSNPAEENKMKRKESQSGEKL
jgi:predicted RND superfamily exporter protein